MSTEHEQRQEQKTKTFRGSSMKHGLGNRVLGWKGQGVERDQSWTSGRQRREGSLRSVPSVQAQELPEDMERGMASTGGPHKGPRAGGPAANREDPAGSTLESLRAREADASMPPCPRERTRAAGSQDNVGPQLQGKAWPAPEKVLSSLKSPASQAQACCLDTPLTPGLAL